MTNRDKIELGALLEDRERFQFPTSVSIDDRIIKVECDADCGELRELATQRGYFCWYEPGVGYVCKRV